MLDLDPAFADEGQQRGELPVHPGKALGAIQVVRRILPDAERPREHAARLGRADQDFAFLNAQLVPGGKRAGVGSRMCAVEPVLDRNDPTKVESRDPSDTAAAVR